MTDQLQSFFEQHLQRYIHCLTIESIDLLYQFDRYRLPFDKLCRLGQFRRSIYKEKVDSNKIYPHGIEI